MPIPPLRPAFPVTAIQAVAAISALVAIASAIWGRAMRPAWLKFVTLPLRLAVIAMLAITLLNPSTAHQLATSGSRSLILIDTSQSMTLAGTNGATTRWQEAVQWVSELLAKTKSAGLPTPAVIPFASSSLPAADDLAKLSPDGSETNLATALSQTLASFSDAPPDQIVVVSDGGAHDRQALPAALTLARSLNVPISTRVVGSDVLPRNSWIQSVQSPRIIRPGSRISVHVSLAETGLAPGQSLPLVLKDDAGNTVAQSEFRIPKDSPGGKEIDNETTLLFDSGLRTTRYTLDLEPAPGEITQDDNHFAFTVEVASAKLRVLYLQGTHVKRSVGNSGYYINDIELMSRAWAASGDIDAVLLTGMSEFENSPDLVGVSFANGEMIMDPSVTFPTRREDLYQYDAMIIGNIPVGVFSTEQMQWVVDWVNERGGGFCMAGGWTTYDSGHYDQTPFEKIVPVDMVAYGSGYDASDFEIDIPQSVRDHPIWRISPDPKKNQDILDNHPPFRGMNRVRHAKPGALILATRPNQDNEPVVAVQNYGRGRSLAFMPDPTGGWATFYCAWGPPGMPEIGPQQELGHGGAFRFDSSAATSASGPPPPYPSTYYGQFWVNVVRWLGENSVRWRRDKLAGRSIAAQAQPGQPLPVAAEVFAVTGPEESLALDVGARLDLPGSQRVRLEYDRDQRQFTGSIPIPTDASGADIPVIFDVDAGGEALTDTIHVGLRHLNPEFTDTAPDAAFLAQLASAAGGQVLDTPAAAALLLKKANEARDQRTMQQWWQPLWTQWPWWTAIIILLGLDWWIRRVGRRRALTMASGIACFLLFLPRPARAQDPSPTPGAQQISTLISQLGARYVRQRDEAQTALRAMLPAAADAIEAATTSGTSEEIRLRAAAILRESRQDRWQLEKVLPGHDDQPNEVWAVSVSPDLKHFYTRGQDKLIEWDASTLAPVCSMAPPLRAFQDWQFQGPVSSMALSPDGKIIAATDDFGQVLLYHTADGSPAQSVFLHDSSIWALAFFPDGTRLAAVDRAGAFVLWDLSTGNILDTRLPPHGDRACALAISPDQRYLVFCDEDVHGIPDAIWVWDLSTGKWADAQYMQDKVSSIVFNRAGTEFIGASRRNSILLWHFDQDGHISEPKRIGKFDAEVHDAIFSPDEKTILATSLDPIGQLTEWDATTGDEVWRCLPLEGSLHKAAFLGNDRLIATGEDAKVYVWRRSPSAP